MDPHGRRNLHPPQTVTTTTTTTSNIPAVNRHRYVPPTSPQPQQLPQQTQQTQQTLPISPAEPPRPMPPTSDFLQPHREAPAAPRPVRQRLPRQPSIGIRRPGSVGNIRDQSAAISPLPNARVADGGRRRSSSEPQRPDWLAVPPSNLGLTQSGSKDLPSLPEEATQGSSSNPQLYLPPALVGQPSEPAPGEPAVGGADGSKGRRRANTTGRNMFGFRRNQNNAPQIVPVNQGYDHGVVDMLDVVDPEVSTLSTLTNVQNSLFVPDLGRWVNRRPMYTLARRPTAATVTDAGHGEAQQTRPQTPQRPDYASTLGRTVSRIMLDREDRDDEEEKDERPDLRRLATVDTIDSQLSDSRYAVLPHGVELQGWTDEEKKRLNDHVRHLLHSRRERFKRSMKGFGQYVRRPLGFFITLYATLITLFGLAWVLFLIGWINVGGRQIYVVHIIDSVLVALFAIMGDGLAPFRAVDTYHMAFIARYHFLTYKLRQKKQLPDLQDHNDLPAKPVHEADLEDIANEKSEFSVLKVYQQKKLDHHAGKFAKSHTFYKPHETDTHHAFPIRLLIAIVVLLDCHSLLQISLGACTWGIYYKTRPFALTTVILCCSITCNVTAGILISIGDHRTRKKEVLERMFRQTLTEEAIETMKKRKEDEGREEQERIERELKEREEAERKEEERRLEEVRQAEKRERDRVEKELKEAEKRRKTEEGRRSQDDFSGSRDHTWKPPRPSLDESRRPGKQSLDILRSPVRQSMDESRRASPMSGSAASSRNKLWKPQTP